MTSVRRFYVAQALASFAGLTQTLDELTEEEVLACLEVEAAGQRRRSVLDRLISRATRLNELAYNTRLKEQFHGTRSQQDPLPGRKEDRRKRPQVGTEVQRRRRQDERGRRR